jgi:hypothetical protein
MQEVLRNAIEISVALDNAHRADFKPRASIIE